MKKSQRFRNEEDFVLCIKQMLEEVVEIGYGGVNRLFFWEDVPYDVRELEFTIVYCLN